MSKPPLVNIEFSTEQSGSEGYILAKILKPNRNDSYFQVHFEAMVAEEMAKKFVDEYYPTLKHFIDQEKIKTAIADEVVALGIKSLKETTNV